MTHLNLNMCEGVTAFGYTGNLPDSNKPPSNDKVETEDSLDGKDKIMDTGHVGYNISSLKTLTTLKIGATGVTDSAILGK